MHKQSTLSLISLHNSSINIDASNMLVLTIIIYSKSVLRRQRNSDVPNRGIWCIIMSEAQYFAGSSEMRILEVSSLVK